MFDIRDYAAAVTGGTLVPGDDADDAVWAGPAELDTLPLTDRPARHAQVVGSRVGRAQAAGSGGRGGPGSPAAAPFAASISAIFLDASSIISSPSMTAPRRSSDVARS